MAYPSRGRPCLSGSVCQIRLQSSVFLLLNARKASLGFSGGTNSEFFLNFYFIFLRKKHFSL